MTKINILSKDDFFGEISLLTNFNRTCTVISSESCLLQTLNKKAIDKILEEFPSIHDKILENIASYNDHDMVMRRTFVGNIPFLRKADDSIIDKVVYLLKSKNYDIGDLILDQECYADDNIYIIMKGSV